MDAITKLLARTPCDAGYDSFVDELAAAGYVIVPRTPTPAMIAAVSDVPTIAASVWRDMLAAAPTIRG